MPTPGSTARRYAEAMLALARDDRTVERFRESLDRVGTALDRETIAVLRDPGISLTRRQDALAAATKDEPAEVRSLLKLLLERNGIAKARITTAIELDERERDDLIRGLERASGRRIRATFAVDPTLIGGAKVQIGDHLIDASLDAQLRALGRQLAS
jgi:F-type H+-transporting ATPase subunit delta